MGHRVYYKNISFINVNSKSCANLILKTWMENKEVIINELRKNYESRIY